MVARTVVQELESAVELRDFSQEDLAFLRQLYFSTRYDILRLEIPDEQKQAILNQQFFAQHHHYQSHFADAEFKVVTYYGRPVGRIYVNQSQDELRLIDIAIVPEFRKKGIGTMLINDLQIRAQSSHLPLRLRVEHDNPARELYFRLGFVLLENENINLHLEWKGVPGK